MRPTSIINAACYSARKRKQPRQHNRARKKRKRHQLQRATAERNGVGGTLPPFFGPKVDDTVGQTTTTHATKAPKLKVSGSVRDTRMRCMHACIPTHRCAKFKMQSRWRRDALQRKREKKAFESFTCAREQCSLSLSPVSDELRRSRCCYLCIYFEFEVSRE